MKKFTTLLLLALSLGSAASSAAASTDNRDNRIRNNLSELFFKQKRNHPLKNETKARTAADVPEILPATDVTPTGFTANWKPVSGAESYLLSIFHYDTSDEKNYVLKDHETKSTSYEAKGLDLMKHAHFVEVAAKINGTVGEISEDFLIEPTIAAPVAKPATDITTKGFTANWDAVDFAEYYGIMVTNEHLAQTDEDYCILDADFNDIKSNGTLENPELVNDMDDNEYIFPSIAWDIEDEARTNGMLGLNSTQFKSTIQAAELDLSQSGGKAKLQFKFVDTKGATKLTVAFVKKIDLGGGWSTDQIMEETMQQISVPSTLTEQTIELTGGKEAYGIVIQAEDGIVMFDYIKAYVPLKKGEKLELPTYANMEYGNKTNHIVKDLSFGKNDKISYVVVAALLADYHYGFFGIFSDLSNPVYVDFANSSIEAVDAKGAENAFVSGGVLHIVNHDGKRVDIYSASGAAIATDTKATEIELPGRGIYVVRVGSSVFKVIK